MRILLTTGRFRIARISMRCQRYSSAMDAAKNWDAVDEPEGLGR